MSRTLYLLRHAKSSWDSPTLHDHDRPLAPRGVKACALISAHLREAGISPQLVLCSTAVRTRETLAGVEDAFDPPPRIEFRPEIYEASAAELADVVRGIPGPVAAAMLIGHQPGIGSLALELAGSGDRLEDLESKFPTAALAAIELEGSWESIRSGSGRLVGFVRPKELKRG
jgi:phosphohistidine phosphatase